MSQQSEEPIQSNAFAEKFWYFAKVESQKSDIANSQKLSKTESSFFAIGFCEILTETTEIIKNFDKCQKCQKFTGIFKNRWYLSKIDGKMAKI